MSSYRYILILILVSGAFLTGCNDLIPDNSRPFVQNRQAKQYLKFLPQPAELGEGWIEVDRAAASLNSYDTAIYNTPGIARPALLPKTSASELDGTIGPRGVSRGAYYYQGLEEPVSLVVTVLANNPCAYPLRSLEQLPQPSAHFTDWQLGADGIASALPTGKLPGREWRNGFVLNTPYTMYLSCGGIFVEIRGGEGLNARLFNIACNQVRKLLEYELRKNPAVPASAADYRMPSDHLWDVLNRLTPPGI